MNRRLGQELYLLFLTSLVALIFGAVFGIAVPLLLIIVASYLLWTLHNLNQLILWLKRPSKNVPESYGVWDEIFKSTYLQYQRQRKSKKKLTSMLTRFQESTRALPYSTIVLNQYDEIEWFNPAAKRVFGLRDKHDSGQNIINLIRAPEFATYLRDKKFKKPLELKFNDLSLVLTITEYGKGQNLVLARDVTDMRNLDAMRRDFIANASHELRTPLTVISGFVEIIQDQAPDNIIKPIENIQKQTERMQRMLLELMELAKLESAATIQDPEEINLRKILNDIMIDARAMDNDRHNLELNADELYVSGSAEELCIAISNLITNAIRYTPVGASIRIYTEDHLKEVCVVVEDEGMGIESEHLPRLTERFYRVDPGRSREQGGTGLGLAIVKHILERHNGKLVINSELGVGSTFKCCLPKHEVGA